MIHAIIAFNLVSVVGTVVERADVVVERVELSLCHVSVHHLFSIASHVIGAASVRMRVDQVVHMSVGRFPGWDSSSSFLLFVLLIIAILRLATDRTVIVAWQTSLRTKTII